MPDTNDRPTRSAGRTLPPVLEACLQRLAGAEVTVQNLDQDGDQLIAVRIGGDSRVILLDSVDHVHRVLVEAVAQVEAVQAEGL